MFGSERWRGIIRGTVSICTSDLSESSFRVSVQMDPAGWTLSRSARRLIFRLGSSYFLASRLICDTSTVEITSTCLRWVTSYGKCGSFLYRCNKLRKSCEGNWWEIERTMKELKKLCKIIASGVAGKINVFMFYTVRRVCWHCIWSIPRAAMWIPVAKAKPE